ncbi:MAG: M1 family aminopeptidase, partial [Thermodesulfobacteriota bacterium]
MDYRFFKIRLPIFLRVLFFLALFFSSSISFASSSSTSSDELLIHEIHIDLDLTRRLITGSDRITFPYSPRGAGSIVIYVGSGVYIDRIESEPWSGRDIAFASVELPEVGLKKIAVSADATSELASFTLTVFFSANFKGIESARKNIMRGVSYVSEAVMGEEGAFLPASSYWYPMVGDRPSVFDVEIKMPEGFTAVMEGTPVSNGVSSGKSVSRWRTTRPTSGVNIVVSRFTVEKELYKGIDIYTYFLKPDKELSNTYIVSTKRYIDLYEGLLPPYPYEKFAVVESFLPTGYGMPSFTLLGSRVLRLPFIPSTSLGHEFVHNWWGNSVFVDPKYGNWSEALAAYTADHLFKEMEGEGRDYRMRSMVEFASYGAGDNVSLMDFRSETTSAARVVGYNKGAMVFHMLRRTIGDDLFYEGLRDFYERYKFKFATWADLQTSFERVSGKELKWFFGQWLSFSAAPRITRDSAFAGIELKKVKEGYKVSFDFVQPKDHYLLNLPVYFKTKDGGELKMEMIVKRKQRIEAVLSTRPEYVEIDPET